MLAERFELRFPPRIDRPTNLEIAAHPIEIVLRRHADVDLDAEVDRHEACPSRHRLADLLVLARALAVVEPDNDRIRVGKILGPVVR